MSFPSNNSAFYAAFISFFTSAFFLLLTSLPLFELLRISFVVATQVFTGAYIWSVVAKDSARSIPMLLGLGLAFGSSACFFAQQIFRRTVLNEVAWFFPLLIILIHFCTTIIFKRFDNRQGRFRLKMNNKDLLFEVTLLCGVALSLSSQWAFLWPIDLVLIATVAIIATRGEQVLSSVKSKILLTTVLLSTAIISRTLSEHGTSTFLFSYDQVFSETESWSLARFGATDNPFEVGSPQKYHWFALGWSGMTSNASRAAIWSLTSIALPVTAFIGISALLWAISEMLTKSRISKIVAVLAFPILWNLNEYSPSLITHSPTFLFSTIWFLSAVFILLRIFRTFSYRELFGLSVLLFVCIGGKFSSGLVLITAVLVFCLFELINGERSIERSKIILIALTSVIVLLLTYLLVFYDTAHSVNGNLWLNQLRTVGVQSGIADPQSSSSTKIFSSIAFYLDMSIPGLPLFILLRIRKPHFSDIGLISILYFVGLFYIFILTANGSAQMYFFLASMCIVPIGLAQFFDLFNFQLAKQSTILIAFIGVVISYFSKTLFESGHSSSSKILGIALPWFSATALYVIVSVRHRVGYTLKYATPFMCSVLLMVAVAISYRLIYQYDLTIADLHSDEIAIEIEPINGSTDQNEIFDWLRMNTPIDDIVATNRFCVSYATSCNSKWMLMTAVSQRRSYIEGGYWDWATRNRIPPISQQTKIDNSFEFAVSPNISNWTALTSSDVSWFVVDHVASSPLSTWEPFATVVMTNHSMTLLRVNQSLTS